MRKLTCSTLLAIVIGLFASQANAIQLVYYQPNDTLFMLPGQSAGGEMFVHNELGDEAVFMSLTFNLDFQLGIYSAGVAAASPGCGRTSTSFDGNHYQLYWQDYGYLCGNTGMHLATWHFYNHVPIGAPAGINGQSVAMIVSADTSNPWASNSTGGFYIPIITYDAIRGDVTGLAESGEQFSQRDIDIADSIWRISDNLGDMYTMTGDNLARSSSYWSYPVPGDVSFMVLARQQPNHPYVRNIHYGEPFTTPRQGFTNVPATPELVGRTLRVSTNGSMAMALAVLPNGSIWAQSGATQDGIATLTDVPEGITEDMIFVEAISIDGVSEVDPFQLPALPSQVELGQNYPNPFNPETTVPFDLQVPANVTLTVYDQLGRQVATLAQGPYQAGRHEVRFNAADLPTGMYFAQLRAGHATSTKKMLLIK